LLVEKYQANSYLDYEYRSISEEVYLNRGISGSTS